MADAAERMHLPGIAVQSPASSAAAAPAHMDAYGARIHVARNDADKGRWLNQAACMGWLIHWLQCVL
jgi:hypothetical protein